MLKTWLGALRWLLAIAAFVTLPLSLIGDLHTGLAGTLAGVLLLFGWHLHHLGRLVDWLGKPRGEALPEGAGVWEDVFAALHRRVRLNRGEQQSLSASLERLTSAFRALPDGVIAFNRHQHIEWINARAESHFSLSAEADRGQALTNLIRHPDFVDYLRRGEFDEPMVYRDGRVAGLVLLLQVIPYGDDYTLLVSRDISQLERLENMRRDFIANVSHELKTPLTVVNGFAEMLVEQRSQYNEEELDHYLGLIRDQSARMRHLVEDLLTLSALEASAAPADEERVDIDALLRGLLAEAQVLSGGRHEFSLNVEAPPALIGNTAELRSAFGNLVGNAVRYTPPGGRIDLSWRVRDGDGEFVVSDTGIGVAAQHLPRLTERFYRVDRSRSRETGGTGLGLSITKHVLARHGGELLIASELGKGSCFIARIPGRRLLP